MEWIFAVIFLFLGIQQTDATCTVPLSSGVWKTNSQGTWTIPANREQIQNFRVKYSSNKAAVTLTMTCMDNTTDTDGYIYLKSDQTVPILNGVDLNVHICMKFEQQSSTNEDAYFFYLGSDLVVHSNAGKIVVYERINIGGFTLATNCVFKSTAGERTNIAIKRDTETAAAVECPSSLIGTFTYSGTGCTSTHLDVCTTRSEYNYNYTVCAEQQMYSANGLLQCVHSTTSGSYSYVTLYNRDSSVDSSTTFEFTCMVYSVSGSTVTASIQPGQCYDQIYQTPTSHQHTNGQLKTFENYGSSSCYTTTPEEASEFPWIYIVIAVAIILLILLLILIIYCCIKRKRKQRQQDEESIAPSEDEGVVEDHQSVIDDKEKEEDQQQELEKDDAIIIQETEKEKEKQKEKERRNSIDSGIQQDDKKMDGPGDKEEKKDGDPDDDQTKVLTEVSAKGKEKGKILDKEEKKDNDNKESAHDIKNKNEDGNVKTVIVQSTEENRDDEERESNSGKKTDNKGDDEKGNDTRTDIKEEVQEGQRSDSERNIRKNEDNDSGTESDDDIDKESEHSIGESNSNVQTSDNASQKSLKVTNKNVVESQNDNVKDNKTVEDSNKDKESDTTHEKEVINTKEKVKKGRDSPEDTKGRQSPKDTKRQHSPNTKHVMEHEKKKKENNNDIKQDISYQHESSETKQIKRIEVKEQEKDKEKDGSDNNDSEKEEEEEKEDDHSDRSGSRCSSRGSKSSDRSEIERNIHKVGMKKRTQYQPQGELSKVLVSREMEEKQRMSKEKGKWKKMKQLFRGKSKKVKDANQQHEDDDRDTQDLFDDEFSNGRNVAPFLKEYQYKKTMDHRFEEEEEEEMERQRRKRDKNGDMYTDSDDEDFEGIFTDSDDDYENDENRRRKDENGQEMLTDDEKKRRQRDENGKEILTEEERKRRQRDENGKEILTEEERKRQSKYNKSKHDKDKLGTDEADELKRKRKSDENAKDSGVDSPDLKKEHSDINGFSENEDFNDFEMIDLPEGYIRDSSGQIVRLEDGKIIEEEELKSIFRLARLGVIFHVPRLKRTSNGRPTGGYIEDPFGPKKEKGRLSIGDGKIDHSKPKHPRSSRASSRKGHRDLYQQKSVAFDMNDDLSDISVHDEGSDRLNENDPTFENRELLKKRLFRNRRRRGRDNRMYQSEDGLPRELNELVRVIPQGQGPRSHMVPLPGTVLTRNDSYRNRFDPEQQQMYRDGLATDRRILEQSPSMQRRPGAPREAFMNGHVTDDMTERMQNEENEERQRRQDGNGVNIGSDDEFFLVGGRQERPEPFFTHVRRHPWQSNGNTSGMMHSVSHDGFCIPHDMRHTMPWSLYVRNPVRESSISDINLNMSRRQVGPKSADNSKRELDDKRLKELLEELYTDKKYFDHVIDTTDPNNEESIIDERHLATHGRDFLLERAEYWDERGVRIPRPPMTALGLRLSRQLTTVPDSGRVSNISYATTATPQPHPFQASNSQELDTPHAFVNQPDHSVC